VTKVLVRRKKLADFATPADRVLAIRSPGYGRVIGRNGDVITVEVTADTAPRLAVLWGDGGFSTIVVGQ